MTQYNPSDPYGQYPQQYGQPPGAYGGFDPYGQLPLGPARPGSVTAIAIIAIIFGSYSVLCTPFGALFYMIDFQSIMPPGSPPLSESAPEIDVVRRDSLLFAWAMGSMAVGMIVGVLELIGGIASLKLKPWGRTLLLTFAWLAIIEVIASLAFNLLLLLPGLQATQSSNPVNQWKAPLIGAGGALLGLILPICVIYFFNRFHVKSAFAGDTAKAGGENSPQFGQPPATQPSGYPSGYGQ